MTQLPSGWVLATLGEVGMDAQPGFASGKHNATGDGTAHLRPMNIDRLGRISLLAVKSVEPPRDLRLRPGDVLFNNTNSPALVGKTAHFFIEGDFAFSNHMTRLRFPPALDPRFVALHLHHQWMQGVFAAQCNHHVNQASISRAALASTPIRLPPLNEQRRIVAAIEEQFSRLDACSGLLDGALARLNLQRAVVLRAGFPTASQSRRLGDVAKVSGGHTPKGLAPVQAGDIPFYKVGDMNAADGNGMGPSRVYLDDEAVRRLRVRVWPRGTVIFPKQGGAIATNKKRYLTRPAACDLNTMGLVPGPDLMPEYLFLWIQGVDLASLSDGSVVAQIKPSRVEALALPVPPLDEQGGIVAELERRLSVIDAMASRINSAQRRSAALRRAILDRAFRGELVRQDPSDEPASALLDRIRADRAAAVPKVRPRSAIREHSA